MARSARRVGQYSTEAQSKGANFCRSPYLYRTRNLAERFFDKIDQYRRIAARHDETRSQPPRFCQAGGYPRLAVGS
jgi:transposase